MQLPTPILQDSFNQWTFVVSADWVSTIQSLAIVSLLSSLLVLGCMVNIFCRHRIFLQRLSLRVSGYVALADLANSIYQILVLKNALMIEQSTDSLRFLIWMSMSSTLFFIFLTLTISIQLHLSTLTRVRVHLYLRLEKFYVPLSLALAVILPAIAVSQMHGVFWIPYMHSFNWSTTLRTKRLVLWLCYYSWIILTIIYCSLVAIFLSLKIWTMWRDSAQPISMADTRAPEKWDWQTLTQSTRSSHDATMISQDNESIMSNDNSNNSNNNKEQMYLVTLTASDKSTGKPVAIRSYVDRRKFMRSVQRLVCYPIVPLVTQLGMVVLNMASHPTPAMYQYGSSMACLSGLLNLAVFLLNPALPDIWNQRQ